METKTKNSFTISSSPKPKRPRPAGPTYSAQDKAQAILRVWTERCKPAEVCREMKINWVLFSQWQQRAMEGMLQALEPRVNLAKGQALSPRLQALLLKRQQAQSTRKLAERLEQIQLAKPQETPAPSP
jgi:transposase-like protein